MNNDITPEAQGAAPTRVIGYSGDIPALSGVVVVDLPAPADLMEASRDNWMEQARQFCRNMEFYRGLLDECAKHLGEAVYISDDGSKQDEPIRIKIPEMVASLAAPVPAPAPTWTKEKPKTPGFYWRRKPGFPASQCLEEIRINRDGAILWDIGDGEWDPVHDGMDWSGPIPSPLNPSETGKGVSHG